MFVLKVLVLAAALLACGSPAYAQNNCDGFDPKAKYRFQWFYQLTDPKAAKTVDALVLKWMQSDCPGALAYGQGGALTTDAAVFGIAAASPTTQFADYAAWSDWASIDDLKKCYEKGLASGNVAAIRKYSKKAIRLVYELKPGSGSSTQSCTSGSYSPATVRFMFTYILAKPGPETCKMAMTLQSKIVAGIGTAVRRGDGCDAVTDDSKVYAPTITNTADYGGYIDFKSLDDMTKYLSNKTPSVLADRTNLRSMAASSMRVAIALPAKAFTNAKPAAAAGRRLME